MPKSYWTKIQTPNGLKYFRADDVTDELLQKIKDEAYDVFYVEYGVTTYADALAAYNAGKSVLLLKTSGVLTYIYKLVSVSSTTLRFSKVDGQLQDTVSLNSANQYSDTHTLLAKTDNVMKTASAEIAPEYYDLCIEYLTEHKFPIPAGTLVTYLDNTSSDVLQYLYKSKVEIDENDHASSDPITAPEKWDKVSVSDIAGTVFYADMFVTPYADIKAAYDRGDTIIGRMPGTGDIYQLENIGSGQGRFLFNSVHGYTWLQFGCFEGQYQESNNWNPQPAIVDIAQRSDIASQYSSQNVYHLGDLAYNGSILYRCIYNMLEPETWTSAHWQITTVQDVINASAFNVRYNDDLGTYNWPTYQDIWLAEANGRRNVTIYYTARYTGAITAFTLQQLVTGSSAYFRFVSVGNDCRLRYVDIANDGTTPSIKYDGMTGNTVAPYYTSLTFPVAKGTLCMHDGQFYRANQDISTSEDWTLAHWDLTDVSTELDLVGQFANVAVFKVTYSSGAYNWPSYSAVDSMLVSNRQVVIIQALYNSNTVRVFTLSYRTSSLHYFTSMLNTGSYAFVQIKSDNSVTTGNAGVDSSGIAPQYEDLTFPIAIHTLCLHLGKLYYANRNITSSESWTASHWQQTSIAEAIAGF